MLDTQISNLYKESRFNYAHKQFFDMVYLEEPFRDTVKRIKEYYKDNLVYKENTGILQNILYNTPLKLDIKDETYLKYLDNQIYEITQFFNLTSPYDYGKIFDMEFYSTKEILLLDETYFNIDKKDWRKLVPVYPILHPWADVEFLVPIGRRIDSGSTGISIVAINIKMLVYMFRCYIQENMNSSEIENIETTIPNFLTRYVLPNMLPRQTDIAIFNIIVNTYYNLPYTKSLVTNYYPLPVHKYLNKVIIFSKKVIDWLTNRTIRYEAMLQTIPAPFEINMEHALILPRMPNTRQVWWALMLSRLEYTLFLIDIGGKESIAYNKPYISSLQRDLSYLQSERIYDRMFSKEYSMFINLKIDRILNL